MRCSHAQLSGPIRDDLPRDNSDPLQLGGVLVRVHVRWQLLVKQLGLQ
jgi:hypothetical protein